MNFNEGHTWWRMEKGATLGLPGREEEREGHQRWLLEVLGAPATRSANRSGQEQGRHKRGRGGWVRVTRLGQSKEGF